jgi:hypothetical protein
MLLPVQVSGCSALILKVAAYSATEPNPKAVVTHPWDSGRTGNGCGDKKHVILLAEDEPLVREALASHLENCGFTVIQVGSAIAAR